MKEGREKKLKTGKWENKKNGRKETRAEKNFLDLFSEEKCFS